MCRHDHAPDLGERRRSFCCEINEATIGTTSAVVETHVNVLDAMAVLQQPQAAVAVAAVGPVHVQMELAEPADASESDRVL